MSYSHVHTLTESSIQTETRSEKQPHLYHGDAESAHSPQGTTVLQLLSGLRVHLDLLLLLGWGDAQEVLGKLPNVHLGTEEACPVIFTDPLLICKSLSWL